MYINPVRRSFNGGGQGDAPMNSTVVTVVLGAAVDMIEASTRNGGVLGSDPAGSLLKASARDVGATNYRVTPRPC